MASFYMIAGFNKNQTGSLDTYFDNFSFNLNSQDYAYLGIPSGSSSPTSSFFTWPVASRANSTLRDSQMYTPFPTGTERGKLYWVEKTTYANDASIPDKGKFVELLLPEEAGYYIVTPSLNEPTLQALGVHIAQYSFVDEDDLFTNGWKSQRGTPSASNPLASEANWNTLVNDPSWAAPPFSFSLPTPGDKAKIVANLLAYTINSHTIQTALGLSVADLLKGAIVLGGKTTLFSNSTYKGLVPLVG